MQEGHSELVRAGSSKPRGENRGTFKTKVLKRKVGGGKGERAE